MTLPNGAHAIIGGVSFTLDEDYESDVGRRCYVHGGRSIFAEQFSITGIPGAQNLRQEDLIWAITNFDGEGQVVLDHDDPDSARLFYRSEGLDFRVPGQFSLNKSSVVQTLPLAGPTATTYQGNADMTDITGTSTTSGTDRKLTTSGDVIGTSANYAPGAANVQVDFYLYTEAFADLDVSIAGSSLKLESGDGAVSGSDFRLKPGATARTTTKESGTDFTAGVQQRVEVYAHRADSEAQGIGRLQVIDVTNGRRNVVAGSGPIAPNMFGDADNPTTPSITVNFTSGTNRDYQFHMHWDPLQGVKSPSGIGTEPNPNLLVDEIRFGPEVAPGLATLTVYNQTAGSVVNTKSVAVTATAAGNLTGSMTFLAAAATNYRFRVTHQSSGPHDPWVDKITATLQSATAWTMDCIEVGLGGRIWAGAHAAAADSRIWRYDPQSDAWEDSGGTVGSFATLNDGAATTDYTVRALAHSDAFEYVLLSGDEVYTVTTAGADDRYAYFSANGRDLVGMTIAQERLLLMSEDTNGVIIYSVPLDDTSTNPWNLNNAALSAGVQTLTITAGQKTPDTNLRQRMCSTPTGARFFVNYGDATSKIYEVDAASSSTLTHRELADLGHGVVAKAIAYEGGLTFIAGSYVAESDQSSRAALWYIDANGVLERLGFFREDAPSGAHAVDLEPYQTNLYILQGPDVWRYDLRGGGLFLEYTLNPTASTEARSLAVSEGRTFALYEDELWVTGTESSYRQSSSGTNPVSTNMFISSINDYGLPGVAKSLVKVRLLTYDFANWSPGTQVLLHYQTDQDGTWTPIGVATSGSQNTFIVASDQDPVTFNTLQIRAIPQSLTGSFTPYVLGIIVTATAAEDEEYFDLVLRCEDEDSSDRVDGQQTSGAAKAQHLLNLWRAGTPVTFRDGYASDEAGVAPSYLTVIRDVRDERIAQGEGRVIVTLKVVE